MSVAAFWTWWGIAILAGFFLVIISTALSGGDVVSASISAAIGAAAAVLVGAILSAAAVSPSR